MTQAATMTDLTPAFKAMTPLQKWETLVLSGLIGTDEPWIEDMRQALREQEGSAALPSEAITDAMIGAGIAAWPDEDDTLFDTEEAHEREVVMRILTASMRAATPTAPVQDDDEKWLRWALINDPMPSIKLPRDRLERIASRRSPTPDTGLIEALTDVHDTLVKFKVARRFTEAGIGGLAREISRLVNKTRTALANAAPAQVESGE